MDSNVYVYAIKWKGADGDHLSAMFATKWNDALAKRRAIAQHKGLQIVSIERSNPQQIDEMKAAIVAANPARVPIEELTGGEPTRALLNPDLLKPDNDAL